MNKIRESIFDAIKVSFTVIGGTFLLNLITAYIGGYEGLPLITEEFLAGKTIAEAYLKESLAIGAVSIITYYASLLYRKTDWSFAKRTIIVFGISIVSFIIMLNYVKILSSEYLLSIIISLLIFVGLYFIYWLMSYRGYKAEIEEINRELKKTGE